MFGLRLNAVAEMGIRINTNAEVHAQSVNRSTLAHVQKSMREAVRLLGSARS